MTIQELRQVMQSTGDVTISDLTAELVAASSQMSAAAAQDDADRQDRLEAIHADQWSCHAVHLALLDLRAEIGRRPNADPWQIVSRHIAAWGRIHRSLESQAEAVRGEPAVCAECGVSAEHDDLRSLPGIGRGVYCEGCAERRDDVAPDVGF